MKDRSPEVFPASVRKQVVLVADLAGTAVFAIEGARAALAP